MGKTVRALRIPEGSKVIAILLRQARRTCENRGRGLALRGCWWKQVARLKGPIEGCSSRGFTIPRQYWLRPGRRLTMPSSFPLRTPIRRKCAEFLAACARHLGQLLNLIGKRTCSVSAGSLISRCTEYDAEHEKIGFQPQPVFHAAGRPRKALNTAFDPVTIKVFQYDIVCNGIGIILGSDLS